MTYESQEEHDHFEGAMEQSVPQREEETFHSSACPVKGCNLPADIKNH